MSDREAPDRVEVCPADELNPGERTVVETGAGEVGVFNHEGELYAMLNDCPHRGGPVCTGKVSGALVGEWEGPGERVIDTYADEPAITCPWHGWDFYLGTGEHVGLEEITVPTYDVVVEDGTVVLEV